jgi:hypothetical protein
MYTLEQPTLIVNTRDIQPNASRQHIIEWVAAVARKAPEGRLRDLVLNCSTLPAFLQLGEGFDGSHLPLFMAWRGLIDKIWLPDYRIARIPEPAMQGQSLPDHPGCKTGDGNLFCSGLARNVHCHVVVPTESQCDLFDSYPAGAISGFEGLVLSYGPDGYVTWSRRKPSACVAGS